MHKKLKSFASLASSNLVKIHQNCHNECILRIPTVCKNCSCCLKHFEILRLLRFWTVTKKDNRNFEKKCFEIKHTSVSNHPSSEGSYANIVRAILRPKKVFKYRKKNLGKTIYESFARIRMSKMFSRF